MSTQSMHSAEHPMELVTHYQRKTTLSSGRWELREPANILSKWIRTAYFALVQNFVKTVNESALSKTELVMNGVDTSYATKLLRGKIPQRTWKRNSAFLVYREQMEVNKAGSLNHFSPEHAELTCPIAQPKKIVMRAIHAHKPAVQSGKEDAGKKISNK